MKQQQFRMIFQILCIVALIVNVLAAGTVIWAVKEVVKGYCW